jgi:hypothetical protein
MVLALQTYPLDGGQEACLFGFRLPYLPDFLTDHTLLGDTQPARLEEVLQRFQRLVTALRRQRGTAFSLRMLAHPESGSVDLYLLGRARTQRGDSTRAAGEVTGSLAAQLNTYGMPYIRLTSAPDCPETNSLGRALAPFGPGVSPYLVEVRQREALVPLTTMNGDAYVIHPYLGPSGSGLELFETLLRQPAPTLVSIYLEPTEVTDEEYTSLAEAAQRAQTYADIEVMAYSENSIRRQRDPGAELTARLYSTYLKSLTEPFLVVAQAASMDPSAAWAAARAFASGVTAQSERAIESERDLPSGAEPVVPVSSDEYSRCLWCLTHLIWMQRAEVKSSPGKERLPYLMGARAAAAAFRFPVSVKGGVPGVVVRQAPPDFEPGPRPPQPPPGEIHLGSFGRGGAASVPVNDLTRHALVTGFTGSGKTNTVLYLLDQTWRKYRIPFLVIEAAKKEYRALARVKGFEDLLVFSLGDETTSPFRLNPFELLPGVRLEAHLNRLQACFDAALPQFGILPSIIAEAMEEIYRTRGWMLTDRSSPNETRLFPTLRDLYRAVIRVAEQRGYAGETYHNIRAAVSGRIGNLLRGSRGLTFGGMRSFPADVIFNRPVVLELDDLHEDDKALVMMFLLTWLREYRALHRGKGLQHLTVVEEAHNVLSNAQSIGANETTSDIKAKSVVAFSNMLSEVRAYGEGLIISDQSPEKLAPDAIRNTNLQVAHQLRDRRDREAIARAMIMDEAQQEYLGKLRTGQAAFFRTGVEKAAFVTIPEYKDAAGFDDLPSDGWICTRMSEFQHAHLTRALPFDGCRFCKAQCTWREQVEPRTMDPEAHEALLAAMQRFEAQPQREHWPGHWRAVAAACRRAVQNVVNSDFHAAFCFLVHEVDFPFTEHMHRSFEIAFREI